MRSRSRALADRVLAHADVRHADVAHPRRHSDDREHRHVLAEVATPRCLVISAAETIPSSDASPRRHRLRSTLPRMTFPPAVGWSRTFVGLGRSPGRSTPALTCGSCARWSAGTSGERNRTIARRAARQPHRSATSASTPSSSSRGWAGSRPTCAGSTLPCSRRVPDLRISRLRQRARPAAAGDRALGGRGRARDASAARPPRHARAHRGDAAGAARRQARLRGLAQRRADRAAAPPRRQRRHDRRRDLAPTRRRRSVPHAPALAHAGLSGRAAGRTGDRHLTRGAGRDRRRHATAGGADRRHPARPGRRAGRRADAGARAPRAARSRARARSCSRSPRCSPTRTSARLVEALPEIRQAAPDATVVVPGNPTPLGDEVAARARELGVGDALILPGWVAPADLEGLYAAASCFVFPSLREGFGLPVLEAMRRGLPVACSNASALPEVAGDAALMFDPHRPDELAAAVARLLRDRELAEELARARAASSGRVHLAAHGGGDARLVRARAAGCVSMLLRARAAARYGARSSAASPPSPRCFV